jgi:hypothetical protein
MASAVGPYSNSLAPINDIPTLELLTPNSSFLHNWPGSFYSESRNQQRQTEIKFGAFLSLVMCDFFSVDVGSVTTVCEETLAVRSDDDRGAVVSVCALGWLLCRKFQRLQMGYFAGHC